MWNWRLDRRIDAVKVYGALSAVVGHPVVPMAHAAAGAPVDGATICDVWHLPGQAPTVVDWYAPPLRLDEQRTIAWLARSLDTNVLTQDDTLDATRFLLVAPDGTVRPVHFDVADTDDGEVLSNRRLCTLVEKGCRGWSQCQRSRWAPGTAREAA